MTVSGLKELDAQLAALANPETAYQIGLEAVMASAELLQEAWIAGAPYAARASTMKYWGRADGSTGKADYGHLRDNITVGPVRAHKINAVVYKVSTGNAFWAYFLEYGTVNMPAYPWARPIVERLKEDLINVQVDILQRGIDAAIAGRSAGATVMANGRNG